MSKLEAIIFDVDGTLADTERDGHRVAFNAAFADAGLDWQWSVQLYGELLRVAGGKERLRAYLAEYKPRFVADCSVDEFVQGLHRRKTEHFTRMLRGGAIGFRPGVLQLLREARDNGVRLAIATTTSPENVTELLAAAPISGLADWFDVIAAGDVVPAKKPAPDIFELALRGLGLPPDRCVALEDSHNGARSALGAGLSALLVTVSTYTRGEDFSGAALVVDGLGEPAQSPLVLGGGCAAGVEPTLQAAGCVNLSVVRLLHRCVYGYS